MDSRIRMNCNMEIEDLNPEDLIKCQPICLSCEKQLTAEMKSNMIYTSSVNDSECPLVCGQLNNTVDKAKFIRKMNQIAFSSAKLNFETHFHNYFWNSKHLDELDLSVVLADNAAQAIYNRGMRDGYQKCHKKNLKSKKKSRKKLSKAYTIQNLNKQPYNSNNITNKLKKSKDAPNTQQITENHSKIKSIEINAQITSSNTLNNSFQPQFLISDNIDESYLPIPALQLMLGSELSNTKCVSDEYFNNKNKDNHAFLTNRNPKKVHHKDNQENELINTDNVKLLDLPPIIPLSVLHYMEKL